MEKNTGLVAYYLFSVLIYINGMKLQNPLGGENLGTLGPLKSAQVLSEQSG